MDPAGQPVQPARVGHGGNAHDGQTDGADGEPRKGRPEVCPGLRTKVGRKDQVPGPEEHGKERKTEEHQFFAAQVLHKNAPFLKVKWLNTFQCRSKLDSCQEKER